MNHTSEFESLCVPLYPQVEALCRRILREPQRAKDATQDSYLKALSKFSELRDAGAARGWLMAIAYRHCLDLLRKPEFTQEVETDLNSQPQELELSLIGQEILDFVAERSRTLLVLRHYLELSYAEIAAVLEIPQNQVGMALVRARQEALKYAEQRGMRDALR